jgi:predicted glycoside hydrolase/deacetylase ChbG (UPF0249 family)
MKRLIVNADDFGLAESVNRGIIVAHRDGILTSASLLANGSAFDQAIAASRQFPQLSVGVHLNISEGRPVSPAAQIPSLVKPHPVPPLAQNSEKANKPRRYSLGMPRPGPQGV